MGFSLSRAWRNIRRGIRTITHAVGDILEPFVKLLGFEDKTIISGAVFTQRINSKDSEDNETLQKVILESVLANTDIARNLWYSGLSGYNRNMLMFYNYGIDEFIYDIPELNQDYIYQSNLDADTVIDGIFGPSDILGLDYEDPTPTKWAYFYLWHLSPDPNFDYQLQELTISAEQYQVQSASFTTATNLEVVWEKVSNPSITSTQNYTTNDPSLATGPWLEVAFQLTAAPGVYYVWWYDISTDVYPELADSDSEVDGLGPLPVAPLRINSVNVDSDKTSELYLTTKKLLNHVSLDIDDLIKAATKDADGNDQPDIAKLKDVYIVHGTSPYSTTQAGIEYLYKFFNFLDLYVDDKTTWENSAPSNINPDTGLPVIGRRSQFTFGLTEHRYNTGLSINYIDPIIVSGVIGEVGEYDAAFTHRADLGESKYTYPNSSFYYRLQISATQYRQIEVHGLLSVTVIVEGSLAAQIVANIEATRNNNVLVPLCMVILDEIDSYTVNDLWQESAHMTVYAAETTDLDWYETPAFVKVFVFVIIVISFIVRFYNNEAGQSLQDFAIALGKYLLVRYAFLYVMEELIDHYGDDPSKVNAIILLGAYIAWDYGSEFFEIADSMDQALLALDAASMSYGKYYQLQQEGFDRKLAEAQANKDAFDEELAEAAEALGLDSDNVLDLAFVQNVLLFRTESPEEFYQRTKYSVNIGPQVIDRIHTLVQNHRYEKEHILYGAPLTDMFPTLKVGI